MNEVMQKPTSMKLLHGVFKRARRHAREEKKRVKMSRGRLNLGGLSADEVALHERQRPRRINSYAPVDPFARREKDPDAADKDKDKKRVPVNLPRYTDMLLASSAARARQGSASQSSHVKPGRHDGDGDAARSRGLLARIAAALCGGGGRRPDPSPRQGRGERDGWDERGADRPGRRRSFGAAKHRRSRQSIAFAATFAGLRWRSPSTNPRRGRWRRTSPGRMRRRRSCSRATEKRTTRRRTTCRCA